MRSAVIAGGVGSMDRDWQLISMRTTMPCMTMANARLGNAGIRKNMRTPLNGMEILKMRLPSMGFQEGFGVTVRIICIFPISVYSDYQINDYGFRNYIVS